MVKKKTFFCQNLCAFKSGKNIPTFNLTALGTTIPLHFVAMPLRNKCHENAIFTTEILKRPAKNSIYDLNPQSIPSRDEMDGLEAAYCGAGFVPQ
ncbi:hypothetical protein AVEN_54640-1 [Araneus ventricosus]|uniref:Uncharacterized protein n=1 Tax=Araneus ventricosus TaxID=182803 RepID=A0A4Y2BM21_ARAVE|nr:hypothetical protein AVEN_54640-1 [Araneus ventricosus]